MYLPCLFIKLNILLSLMNLFFFSSHSENYSPQKRKLFRDIIEVINADILSKRIHSGQPNEFIKRKVVTEKCARQLRTVFANIFCDFEMIVWIHQLILEKGSLSTVTSYLNILQALRPKVRRNSHVYFKITL